MGRRFVIQQQEALEELCGECAGLKYLQEGFWNMFTGAEKSLFSHSCRGGCGIAPLFDHILYGRGTIRHTSAYVGWTVYWDTHNIWSL